MENDDKVRFILFCCYKTIKVEYFFENISNFVFTSRTILNIKQILSYHEKVKL